MGYGQGGAVGSKMICIDCELDATTGLVRVSIRPQVDTDGTDFGPSSQRALTLSSLVPILRHLRVARIGPPMPSFSRVFGEFNAES